MMRCERLLAHLALFGLLTGCPGRDEVFDGPFTVLGPVEGPSQLVYALAPARSLVVLDPAQPERTAARRLPFEPRDLAVAGGRAVAIGLGEEGPALAHASITELDGAVSQFALPGVYDRVLLAPDGAHAVLVFDPNRAPEPGAPAARNANEIAVVDFEAGVAQRVVLQTESLAPRAVRFDPRGRRAAVILDSAVVVLDLADPARRVTVPLVLDGGARLYPEQARFASDGEHLFVQAAGTADVLALALVDDGESLRGTINFLFAPGAERLHDIIVPQGEGFAGFVAAVFSRAGTSGSLVGLLEASGDRSSSRVLELDATVTRLEDLGQGRLLLHSGEREAPSRGGAAVVSWAPLEDRVDEDQLAGPVIGVPAVAGPVAFFRHDTGSGREALTAVSVFAEQTRDRVFQRPLVLSASPASVAADPSGDTVLLGVDVAREDSGAAPDYEGEETGQTGSLVLLSPAEGTIDAVVLDEVVTKVGAVGEYFYAAHPDLYGDVTFVLKADPRRSAAHRRDGFLLSGLLDAADEE